MKDLPSNVKFYVINHHSTIALLNDKEFLLNATSTIFNCTTLNLSLQDNSSNEDIATFTVRALLVKSLSKDRLQELKLKTDTVNTYRLSLEFSGESKELFSLSGRHTSQKRNMARKLLLSGLSSSEYDGTIEEVRRDVLHSFSNYTTTNLFEPNNVRIQANIPRVNTWLVKLLG